MMSEGDIKALFKIYLGGKKFKVNKVLGVGGMGTVVSVHDMKFNVDRAIKMIDPDLLKEPEMVKRFENEAKILESIRHPNVVEVKDMGEVEGYHFIVLEWVDGGSLKDHLEVFGKPPFGMPPRQAFEIICRICDGLQVAHDLGIVHRDMKPDNILVTKLGIPKITDFGIAHMDEKKGELTGANMAMGTPGYMPLEQMMDATNVDVRADVHAIGVTFWTLLTALFPSPKKPFGRYLEENPNLLESVPECLRDIIRRATALFPDDRYGSIRELVAALKALEDRLPSNPEQMAGIGMALDVKQYLKDQNSVSDPTMLPQAIEATLAARAAAPPIVKVPTEPTRNVRRPRVETPKTVAYSKMVPPIPSSELARTPIVATDISTNQGHDPIVESVLDVKVETMRPEFHLRSHVTKIGFGVFIVGLLALGWVFVHSEKGKEVERSRSQEVEKLKSNVDVHSHDGESTNILMNFDASDAVSDISNDATFSVDIVQEVLDREVIVESDALHDHPQPLLKKEGRSTPKKIGETSKKAIVVKAGETNVFPEKKVGSTVGAPLVGARVQADTAKVLVSLEVIGDATAHVYLESARGKFRLPTSVIPGTYRVVSTFKEGDGDVITIEVKEGSPVKIACNANFATCKKR